MFEAVFKVTMMLADFAQVAEGKLNVIGGGWTVIGPDPSTFAIGMLIEVPWDRTNEQLHLDLELVDSDARPVLVETPEGEGPLVISGDFEVGRPLGLVRGTPVTMPVALNLPPQPIPPGGRYEWRLTLAGESPAEWRLPFSVRPSAG